MMRVSKFDFIEPYDAGKFPQDISAEYKVPLRNIVNLNSNENPYPLPRAVLNAIYDAARSASRYPSPKYTELKEAIASYIGVSKENITVGSGANEIFSRICFILEPFDEVVIPIPTYTMYAFYAMMHDARIKFVQTSEEKNFVPSADEIIDASEDAKLIFICSPNNPTGTSMHPDEIKRVAESVGDAIVVVDEAYAEFAGRTAVHIASEFENIVVVRSFSKFFGLAGLRIGYAVSSPEIASLLEKLREPFAVSSVAEKAAIAAIEHLDHFKRIRNKIVKERERLFHELKRMKMKPFPSDANFILVKFEIPDNELIEFLHREGIIVRSVTGLLGLDGNFVRITVGKKRENRKLISALGKLMQSYADD